VWSACLRGLVTLLAALGVGASALEAQPATLEVRVILQDGTPVNTAGVSLHTLPDSVLVRSDVTASDGRVRFIGVTPGRYAVSAERIGYTPVQRQVEVAPGVTLLRVDLVARERPVDLPGVTAAARRTRARFEEDVGASFAELSRRDLKLLPGVAEADVLRAVEILPGVVSTSDFSSAFNVRGGSADQNLILLDGLPIYNPFHLGGLFSVFNSDMVGRAELLAGGFPARYGGRVSSVLSVESDAGSGPLDVQAGVSMLAARVAAGGELPSGALDALGLGSARMRISGRRSYFDQILRPFFDFPYHLTDLQLYGEAWTKGGGRLTLTGYTGRDVLDLAGADSFPLRVRWDWGNSALGGAWVRPLGERTTVLLRLGHTRFTTGIEFPEFGDTEIRSRIDQTLLRAELAGSVGGVQLDAGAAVDRLSYDNLAESAGTVFGEGAGRGWLFGGHAQAQLRAGRLLLEAGLRVDTWRPEDEAASAVVQPRAAVKWFLGPDAAIKFAAGRYGQFMHSLRDEELPLGIDVWVLSGARAPVVVSDQLQAGLEGFAGSWFGSLEAYYRWFDGVAANNPAEDPNDPLDDLLRGTGRSYGADLHVRREGGTIRPMVALSFLKAWREFPDFATGEEPAPIVRYAPVFDRRLDVDVVVQAMLGAYELGVRWNLGTGLPYTRPRGGYIRYDYSTQDARWRYPAAGDGADLAIALGLRNGERYPVYHRLDAGIRRTYARRWGSYTPYIDVLNIYNRRNVLFYFYQYDTVPATRAGLSMFPVLPTAGLEVRF
jgi:hypothetical protein